MWALRSPREHHDLYGNETKGRLHPRPRTAGGRPRLFCARILPARVRGPGLKPVIAQANIAFNRRKGTAARHALQFPPRPNQDRAVHAGCDAGRDRGPAARVATYLQHVAVELSAENHRGIYVPERFAHGYQALEDKTETTYQVGEFYTPGSEGGSSYDDPRLGSEWPLPIAVMSEKDRPLGRRSSRQNRKSMRTLRTWSRRTWQPQLGEDVMIIVDTALRAREAEGRPDPRGDDRRRLHGSWARNQIINAFRGMRVVAIYNRHMEGRQAYTYATEEVRPTADTQADLDDAILAGSRSSRRMRSCSRGPSTSTC